MAAGRTRDSEASQEKILDAAEKLFISHGFSATSLRQVAAEAEVAKSLIFHHFQTKAELWEKVKARRMCAFAQRQQEVFDRGVVSLENLTNAIRDYFKLLRNDPSLVRLMTRTELEDPHSEDRFDLQLARQFIERLELAQAQGVLRADIQPPFLMSMILCAVNHWFQARQKFAQWPGIAGNDKSDDEYLDSFINTLVRGVVPSQSPSQGEEV